jgi:LysM repeat protein
MISFRLTRIALVLMGSAVLCGCFPSGPNQADEEREPHFQAGRARVNAMDYTGAIEEFEKALEVNPHSALAHFELGWLYEEKDPDPAAAIYHYQQYLKLKRKPENADTIKQHIFRLKQELAEAVLPLPSMPGIQHEMDQLAAENRRLQDEVKKWRAYYASRSAPPGNTPTPNDLNQRGPAAPPQAVPPKSPIGAATRTHKIQAGDTLAAIARQYGVKLEALMVANPGLNPRRLQIGKTLNVPAR